MRCALLSILVLFSGACNTMHQQHVVTAATPEQNAALLGRIKSLQGTWEGTVEGGDGSVSTATYTVTSHGTAVREIMFPGSPHEMTNMYTMDGGELLMTHYCAMGNQPHMKAVASDDNRIVFKSAGVSNLTKPDEMYMGEMTIEFIDADHIKENWQSLENGKPGDHSMTVVKTRKR